MFKQSVVRWIKSEEGQAMSEYGLVLAIAAVGAIAVLVAFRDELKNLFNGIMKSIRSETSSIS